MITWGNTEDTDWVHQAVRQAAEWFKRKLQSHTTVSLEAKLDWTLAGDIYSVEFRKERGVEQPIHCWVYSYFNSAHGQGNTLSEALDSARENYDRVEEVWLR